MSEKIKTTVIVTYNSVDGFRPGWHNGARLFIHATEKGWGHEHGEGNTPEKRATAIYRSLYKNFYITLNMDQSGVNEFYVYAGENAMHCAFGLVLELKNSCPDARVVLVSCFCLWEEKVEKVLRHNEKNGWDIELIPCECGGQYFLGRLAKRIVRDV